MEGSTFAPCLGEFTLDLSRLRTDGYASHLVASSILFLCKVMLWNEVHTECDKRCYFTVWVGFTLDAWSMSWQERCRSASVIKGLSVSFRRTHPLVP